MNRVYALAPNEDWIVDRFVKEFNEDNADIAVADPRQGEVVWLMAEWCSERIPKHVLASRAVLTTIHHCVPEKWGQAQLREFMTRDAVTTAYHVPNKHTEAFIRPLTEKPIHVIPYWGNDRIWRPTGVNGDLRKRFGLPIGGYLVGSFVRDTEGAGLTRGEFLPKLEKGPDLLADYLENLHPAITPPLHVVLAGWRRQYLISRLEKAGIPYTYFELPSQETLNELYQTLDLYPVTARYEGGPQGLIEAGLLGVPCVSRDIGIASQVLPPSAINDDISLATPAVPRVDHLRLPGGYKPFRDLIQSL